MIVINTGHGYVTSYHEAWKNEQGGPVWTWRTDGPEPHDFGTRAEAQAWADQVFRLSSQKERDAEGWKIEERPR
jgi:hypothetical protein